MEDLEKQELDIPVVVYNRASDKFASVYVDNYGAGMQAAKVFSEDVYKRQMLHSYGMDMKYGADYFSMVTRELWPELHWMFPCLSQKKEKNFVAGASMGGYIAYKWALPCPRCV